MLDLAVCALARRPRPVHRVVVVREGDLAALPQGALHGVDVFDRRAVLRPHAAFHVDDALECPLLRRAGEAVDLLYDLVGAAVRQEKRALHGVHHERELLERELPLPEAVFRRCAMLLINVQPHLAQGFDVAVDALAFAGDAELAQSFDDLVHGQAMLLVGVLDEHARYIEKPSALFGGLSSHGGLHL